MTNPRISMSENEIITQLSDRYWPYILLAFLGLVNIGLIKWSNFYKDYFHEAQAGAWLIFLASLLALNINTRYKRFMLSVMIICLMSSAVLSIASSGFSKRLCR